MVQSLPVMLLPIILMAMMFEHSGADLGFRFGAPTSGFKEVGIMRIPMRKVLDNCDRSRGGYKCRYTKKMSAVPNNKRKRSSGIDTLADIGYGSYWMGPVGFGTPSQTFNMDFDTGSSDMWVIGSQCGSSCGGTHIFKSSASSTYRLWNKPFYILYGDGSNANGTWANDTVTIAGISVVNQSVAIINSAQGMQSRVSDGILGMGYQKFAQGGENPVVYSMYLAGKLTLPIFAFWFGPVSNGNDTGELILGGYDASKCTGAFTYAPVPATERGYWEFTADSITVTTGSTINTIASSINAILDTGTTAAIVGPSYYVAKINQILGATLDPNSGWYIVNCQTKPLSAFPNITVTINGTAFTLTPLMYLMIAGGPSTYTCYSTITALDTTDANRNPIWILGDFFLRRFCSVFDFLNNRIGLALSISYSVVQTPPSSLFRSTTTLFPPSSTTTTTTTATLPPQCRNYTTISDSTRLTTAPANGGCDSSLFNSISTNTPSYVRFVSPGGTMLATSAPNSGRGMVCGTYASGWTNATYPSAVGQTVNAFVCFAYNGNACYGYLYWVAITNCNGYYVHGLYSPGACAYRYCTK